LAISFITIKINGIVLTRRTDSNMKFNAYNKELEDGCTGRILDATEARGVHCTYWYGRQH